MQNTLKYYTGKTVLITGASGFIGRRLAQKLSLIDCHIIRLTSRDPLELEPLPGNAKVSDIRACLCDTKTYSHLNPQTIFHLAAQTNIKDANENPVEDFENNLSPIINYAQSDFVKKNAPNFVIASTVTIYGITDDLLVNEEQDASPLSIYDVHKLHAENYLQFFSHRHGFNYCSLRLSNVYGPGPKSVNSSRGVLNFLMRHALAGNCPKVYGDGQFLRDYIYIDDVVSAFIHAGVYAEDLNGKYFNICSGTSHLFVDAVKRIITECNALVGGSIELEYFTPDKPMSAVDTRNFNGTPKKFSSITGWSPLIELKIGIKQTLKYYNED